MPQLPPHAAPPGSGETIAAVATAPGVGGVGIVRVSGPEAAALALRLFRSSSPHFKGLRPRYLHHGHLTTPTARPDSAPHTYIPDDCIDEVLLAWMPGPHSYTGEDVVEFHCHGGRAILAAVLEAVLACGARTARPGEFTKRAFLNGKLDLTQAEAVAEAIAAPCREGLRLAQAKLSGALGVRIQGLRAELLALKEKLCLALDFSEEDLPEASAAELDAMLHAPLDSLAALLAAHGRARAWREGVLVVLAGAVNAGKSSLLNALLGFERAIVTPVPGTTRDYLEEPLLLDGLPLRLVDTAGLRETGDIVERQGLARSRDLAAKADLVLLVHDAALPLHDEERRLLAQLPPERVLALCNKCETAPEAPAARELAGLGYEVLAVSAKTGVGLERLTQRLRQRLADSSPADELAPNLRQSQALALALEELQALRNELRQGQVYELLDVRLEAALRHLAEVTGEIAPEEVLQGIFDRFCIGK